MTKRPTVQTREQWLHLVVDELRPLFRQQAGVEIPAVQLSVGWPHGKRTIGECWPRGSSSDGTNHIFISPLLAEVGAIATLAHELCHAVDDGQHGHAGPFVKLAKAVGLLPGESKGWGSTNPSPELVGTWIAPLLASSTFPAYPHGVITVPDKERKQPTRMRKVVCPDPGCGYTLRTTQKWIDLGLPTCFCGEKMETPDDDA